jgi:hypothetical protein
MSEEEWRRDMNAANTKRKQSSRDQGIFSGLLGHTHLPQENGIGGGYREGGESERARESESKIESKIESGSKRERARESERERARESGTPERWRMARQSPE